MRVAVVGGGVSGLAAAHELLATGGGGVRVTLYEEEDCLGGHARTVAVADGVQLDLGFMSFNQATYPHMLEWLEGLGVEMERSDMSFSVSTQSDGGRGRGCEWGNGNGISSLLVQKANILKPSFWRMVYEILKFKKDALTYLEYHEHNPDLDRNETLGQFIQSHGYSLSFQEAYLVPVCTGMWSRSSQGVSSLSAFSVLSFFRNHDLLQLFRHPQLPTVKPRSQSYVNKVKGELESMGCRIKTKCRVKSVSSFDGAGYRVLENDGSEETYDSVILGVHAPNALKLLGSEATHYELKILGACQYVQRDIYLHGDLKLLPRNPTAWSAWNFLGTTSSGFSVTYWLNHIQEIESVRPFLVTLNPPCVPDHVLLKWSTNLHIPSVAAAKAYLQFDQIQGKRGIWFCGAYEGHGCHADGLESGKVAAQGLLGRKYELQLSPKQMIPSWTEAGARFLVARFFNQFITIGNLILVEEGGSVFNFGKACEKCRVKSVIRVHDPLFYWKVGTEGNIGLAEAYINGYFSVLDKREGLLNLILILIANREARRNRGIAREGGRWTPFYVVASLKYAKYFLRHVSRKNTATQTRRNISQHYDLSNDFFTLFLDKSMTYSCAVFQTENESLEAAQQRKLSLLITKAKVEAGHHVLDIGSGWGSLAIQLVKQTGCKYTGVTLSEEQLKYAEKKVKQAGLEATYPHMLEWLEGLGVEMERSDMSFSVSTQSDGGRGRGCEWGNGNGISSLLVQKANILKPSFWRMVYEILKFKKDALTYLEYHEHNPDLDRNETLGQFIQSHGYSLSFQEAYLVPVCTGMWSRSSQGVSSLSAFSVLSFFRNHDLLQLFRHPQLPTVKPRSQSYVNKVKGELESMGCRIKTKCRVKSVSSFDGAGYRVLENDGSEETYDSVILGVHAPNALKLLGSEATHYELKILGACQYVQRDIYLHGDLKLLPRNPTAWSAWNFLGTTSSGFSVTYWLNHIQEIESVRPFLVTLNPPCVPDHVLLKWSTNLHIPSVAAAKAYLQFDQIQGKRGIWFCGAYEGHGCHADGLESGKVAAQGLLGRKYELQLSPKQMIPSWTEAGARFLVARFFNQFITIGNLILVEEGGSVFNFGKACEKCRVKSVIRVHDPLFYWKVGTEGNIGLAEAYINGYFSVLDKREGLLNLILILIANREARRNRGIAREGGRWTPFYVVASLKYAKYFLRHVSRKNTATQTRRNISQHYDLSNDFFTLFLDKSMTYSCAVFQTENESLEAAQQRKLSLLITKAKVEAGHHVLDIGSGWGSLAIQLVKQTGCKYTGVTLSEEQLKYAEKKVKQAGLEENITFLLCDYRKIPPCKYDAIISCGMIEHVGHEYMDEFFACCESHLAEDGILVLQFISIPDERYEQFRRRPDFIKEYIFPGGCLPSLSRVTSAMSASSRLSIEHVESIGCHYYTTLMRWRDNFFANKDGVLAMGFDDRFIRIWEYYLIYSAAGFKSRAVGDYQVVFSRPGNRRLAIRLDG